MKILLVTEFFPQGKDLRFSGGVEARTYFLAKYLTRKHDVHVICTRQKNSKPYEKISGVKVHRIGPIINYTSGAARVFDVLKFISFVAESIKVGAYLKPDIVDGGNFNAHLIAKQISIKNHIPVVFWYPDVFIGQWIKTSGAISGSAGWLLEKFNILRNADQFIAISHSTAQKLEKQNVDPKKISYVPCGIDPSEFKIKVTKSKTKTILTISRLVSYKRVKDAILAFAILLKSHPDLNLTIIGSGPEKSKLAALAQNIKITNKINFYQNLPRKSLINKLKLAYVFCLPSAVEGFGITVLESAGAGVPFVISDIDVFKEITQNGKGGLLFKVGDALDLSTKLERLFLDKSLYRQKAQEAINLAKIYNWQDIASQTENIYKNLINSYK